MAILVLLALLSACAPTAPGTDVFEVGVQPATQANTNESAQNELRPVIQAMLGGSLTAQLELVEYSQIACATVTALGGPPPCPEGAAEGTLLEVFPMLGPEGSFASPENMEMVLNGAVVKKLYAAYRVMPNPNLEAHFPQGEYAVVFERDVNDFSQPVILQVRDGRIVRMDFRFGVSAADVLKEIPVEQVVITPQEAQAWNR